MAVSVPDSLSFPFLFASLGPRGSGVASRALAAAGVTFRDFSPIFPFSSSMHTH